MAHLPLTQNQHGTSTEATIVDSVGIVATVSAPPQVRPLRFAVSLTNPQGKELFRKQFRSSEEADKFAMATSALCPEYKVSSVDRIGGLAYEVKGHSITIIASANSDSRLGLDKGQNSPV